MKDVSENSGKSASDEAREPKEITIFNDEICNNGVRNVVKNRKANANN